MGKIYTYIHKGQQNSKCKTVDLSLFLENGWEVGWPNQHDHMVKMSMKAAEKLQTLKDTDYEEYLKYQDKRSSNVSKGLYKFWSDVADDEYIQNREIKKQQSRDNWSDEEKILYYNKMSESAKRDRASTSPEEYHRRSILATQTKKKNGTMNTSSFEDVTYDLLKDIYGDNDIIHDDYIDNRYSTKCDFYIKSLDIFIELNIHPSHGKHSYNEHNEDDLFLAEQLRLKNDKWSNMILDVWCNRDVSKLNQAKENNLNYIPVYSDDFDSFILSLKENRIWDLVK